MFENLREAEKHYEDIAEQLMNPDVVSDTEKFKSLMKEHKNLTPIIEKYRAYRTAEDNLAQARELLDEGGLDPEMKEMAEEEIKTAKSDLETLTEELKILLLPRDENDDRNVIVEIRAGTGGEEAALFAHSLFRMYSMYAESKGFKTEILNSNETELGGVKEISFMVEGDGAYSRFKFESGVHRVQRVPETETQGRIHTSAVTVAVLPEAEDVEVELNEKDIKKWRSTRQTLKSTPTAAAAPAVSMSTRPTPRSASRTSQPALWWNARTNAVSSRTAIKP